MQPLLLFLAGVGPDVRRWTTLKAVRVWGEAGITVAVSGDPPQFLKVMFGHERIAPSDSKVVLDKYEKLVNDYNEEVVERRAKRYRRLIRRINSGTGKETH